MHIYTERERKESLRMLKREFSSDLKQLNTAMFYVKKKTKRIIEMLVRNMHTYVLKCDIYSDYMNSEFIYSKKYITLNRS